MAGVNLKSIYAETGAVNSAQNPAITPDAIKADIVRLSEPKFRQAQVDLSIDISEPVPVLKQGDYIMFSRGNISTIGGKAKSRKTFLIILLSNDFLESNNSGSVLIVDSEMAKAHTYKTARRIHRLTGWDANLNNDHLTVLSLREYSPDERTALFVDAIKHLRPELVFVDGIRDLVKDFNNVEESTKTVGMLMKLSSEYDCHISVVLHENKVGGQLRGHLGTEVINKSETVLSVTNNGESSTVEPLYTRNLPFKDFTFRINFEGLPEYCDNPVKSAKIDKLHKTFESILSNEITLLYADLRSKVMEVEGIKISAAQNRISEAANAGIIVKCECGYYLSKSINDDDSLPF